MSSKLIEVPKVGEVAFYKRRSSKSIRLRISGSSLKVTMPSWMPYKVASSYVTSKADWINKNLSAPVTLQNGDTIGKSHLLKIKLSSNQRYSAKIQNSIVQVNLPESMQPESAEAQSKIIKTAQKVLQIEAEELIIPRARRLASEHVFEVGSISIKNLKSRWGSCNSAGDLAFSLFLVQLPWTHIDYVIYHELAHTKYLNHSSDFWQLVASYVPNYKLIKHDMKTHSPQIIPQA